MAGPRDYRTFGERDAQLFRDLIAGSRSSSRPASPSASPSGIMAPRGVNMEEEARRSAEEAAAIRGGMGITESLRGPLNIEDSIVGQVARSMGANADDPESVATAVTTVNTDIPRANAGIQAYADMRPVEETLALGAGDQTLAALGRPDPLDMPDREGTTQGFTPPAAAIPPVATGPDVVEDMDVDAKARATDRSVSDQAYSVPEGDIREAQTVLNNLNLYRNGIDGRAGRGTSNAIKTYQYMANLPITGELDVATREALGSNEVPRDERPEDYGDPLLTLLSEGERTTYSSANNYNSPRRRTEWSVYGSYFSDRYDKPISEMTLNEIQDIQSGGYGNREVFAVGAYQMIPDTLSSTVDRMNLSGDTVFDAETQNAMGRDLLLNKPGRDNLRSYLLGEEGASEEAALLDLAREWASMPDPRTGDSYYASESYGGQSSHIPLEEVRQALREQRNIIMKEYGRTFESEE